MTQGTASRLQQLINVDQNEDPSRSTRITKGAEGKVMGMERKRLKTEKKMKRKLKRLNRARQAWAQKLRFDSSKQRKVRITKRIGKDAKKIRKINPTP